MYDFVIGSDITEYEQILYLRGYDDERFSHELFHKTFFYIAKDYHDERRHDFFLGFSEGGFSGYPDYNFYAHCQDDDYTEPLTGKGVARELGICTIEKDTATITIMESDLPERVNLTYTFHFYFLGGPIYMFDNACNLTFGYVDSTTVTLYE